MPRPQFSQFQCALESWDVLADDNFNLLFLTPFPPALYNAGTGYGGSGVTTLPAPGSYDLCLCAVSDYDRLMWSHAGVWSVIPIQGASVPNATGWADATAMADFNNLLAILRASNMIS